MVYYKDYRVDPQFINGGTIEWENTGNGEYIIGTEGKRRFFIKKNLHVRYPTRDLPRDVYKAYKEAASALEAKQEALSCRMSTLSWDRDNVVVEEKHFWDHDDNLYVTVTACIPSALPGDFDYSALSAEEFRMLALTAAKALKRIHGCKVIHGDLKPKNIVVQHESGRYIPYIIDFDSSYMPDAIPEYESIGGTDGFRSPECEVYMASDGSEGGNLISTASDIFTLGIVFHHWWTGTFPGVSDDKLSVSAAVYLGQPIVLSDKFNCVIGDDCGATFLSLLNWMLQKDPADRPTAQVVAEVLADRVEVPEKFRKGKDITLFERDLWKVHEGVIELYTTATLKKKGVRAFSKINEGNGSAGLKYCVAFADGTKKNCAVGELCSLGLAKRKKAHVDEPWPEHNIVFASADDIAEMGVCRIARFGQMFRKRYLLTTSGGMEFDRGWEWLVSEGLAKVKSAVSRGEEPWPEHGSSYVQENMDRMGIQKIAKVTYGGEHRYRIVYKKSGGTEKVTDNVMFNNIKLMGLIR